MTSTATLATLDRTLRVSFQGLPGREGPLTQSQIATLRWSNDMSDGGNYIMEYWLLPPNGTTVAEVVAAFEVLLRRHEALRTVCLLRGERAQRVLGAGDLTLEVHRVPGGLSYGQSWALHKQLLQQLRTQPMNPERDLPLRVALADAPDGVAFVSVIISHMVADLTAWLLLRREFDALMRGNTADPVGPSDNEPLDQADREQALTARHMPAAESYLATQLRRIPQAVYAVASASDRRCDSLSVQLRSVPAIRAVQRLRDRTGGSTENIVLAAAIAVVGRRVGQPVCPVQVFHHSRTDARLRAHIGTVARDGLVVVDTDAPTFDTLVRRVSSASLVGAWKTLPAAETRVADRIAAERGVYFARDFVFNNLSGAFSRLGLVSPANRPGDIQEFTPDLSVLECATEQPMSELLLFRLLRADGLLALLLVTGDPERLPRVELQSLLRAVERLLVLASEEETAGLAVLLDATGLTPIERGPDWSYVDSCWIERSTVQRLVAEAVDATVVATFVATVGDRPAVVAYLVPGERIRTPEQAHAACLARLPGHHPTAIAPARYVFCSSAPVDPTHLVDWLAQPVLIEGGGRAPVSPP
jgi:hypothetical protein